MLKSVKFKWPQKLLKFWPKISNRPKNHMEQLKFGLCCCKGLKRPIISFEPPKRIEVYHLKHEERMKLWNPKVSTKKLSSSFWLIWVQFLAAKLSHSATRRSKYSGVPITSVGWSKCAGTKLKSFLTRFFIYCYVVPNKREVKDFFPKINKGAALLLGTPEYLNRYMNSNFDHQDIICRYRRMQW